MKHWYTADPHFFHLNILKHCNRPFATIEAMNAALVANIQTKVQRHDHLWFVGDFSFRANKGDNLAGLFAQIPGQKHLIRGNHDGKTVENLPWASKHDRYEVHDGKHRFFLDHYPLLTWPGIRHGCVQLFGHVHQNWAGSNRSVNVGVDFWDFAPMDAEAILARVPNQPKLPFLDELEPGLR